MSEGALCYDRRAPGPCSGRKPALETPRPGTRSSARLPPMRLRGYRRSLIVIAPDVALAAISYPLSLWLRLRGAFFSRDGRAVLVGLAPLPPCAALVLLV